MKIQSGKCSLCGRECVLTFEHIPPRAAFNSNRARPVGGKEIFNEEVLKDENRMPWDIDGLRYVNQQQGMGRYSLCKECNNNTGAWCGYAYVYFARVINTVISKSYTSVGGVISIKDVYPLRIIKQIASMFCSVNNPNNPQLDDLRNFVLAKEKRGIDKSLYKICLYFTKSTLQKQSGMMVLLEENNGQFCSIALSEIVAYPFGVVLYFDPQDERKYPGVDITFFADFEYDDFCELQLPWDFNEMNSFYPEDYRSKEEIMKHIEETKQNIDRHN